LTGLGGDRPGRYAATLAVWSEGASTLGVHLAEMDKLLRDIQSELLPDREPAPALAEEDAVSATAPPAPPGSAPPGSPTPPPTTAPPPAAADPQLQSLTELSAGLLASMRELLAGYERILLPSSRPVRRSAPPRARPGSGSDIPDVTLSAAPFVSLTALHEFEEAVARLPGVREVAVRGYEGTDRAIIEVRLDRRTP
jgi:hypothetical protein